jgi:hypothetical protein
MEKFTPKKLNALVLIGIGVLLMIATEPLVRTFSGSSDGLLAALHLVSPLGLIIFIIGGYRYLSKDKGSQ